MGCICSRKEELEDNKVDEEWEKRLSFLEDNLRTGDVLFTTGPSWLTMFKCGCKSLMSACVIQFGQGGQGHHRWVHAGIIWKKEDGVYLVEAKVPIVRVIKLRQRIIQSGKCGPTNAVAIRQLKGINIDEDPQMKEKFEAFVKKMNGLPYEKEFVDLINSVYDGPGGETKDNDYSAMFCSELVAAAYMKLGLLDTHISAAEYSPVDFAYHGVKFRGEDVKKLKLKDGLDLDEMIYCNPKDDDGRKSCF